MATRVLNFSINKKYTRYAVPFILCILQIIFLMMMISSLLDIYNIPYGCTLKEPYTPKYCSMKGIHFPLFITGLTLYLFITAILGVYYYRPLFCRYMLVIHRPDNKSPQSMVQDIKSSVPKMKTEFDKTKRYHEFIYQHPASEWKDVSDEDTEILKNTVEYVYGKRFLELNIRHRIIYDYEELCTQRNTVHKFLQSIDSDFKNKLQYDTFQSDRFVSALFDCNKPEQKFTWIEFILMFTLYVLLLLSTFMHIPIYMECVSQTEVIDIDIVKEIKEFKPIDTRLMFPTQTDEEYDSDDYHTCHLDLSLACNNSQRFEF